MDGGDTIAIGRLSSLTGCNIETIRYYERIGILPPAARRGRYRSFGGADIDRLRFVRRARALGFTLDEVRALLGFSEASEGSCLEARNVAASHLSEVRKRIADLKRMERVLARTVRACDTGTHQGCPLVDALSGTG